MNQSSPKKAEALIAFGANQGDAESTLRKTVESLQNAPQILELKCSQAVRTKAITGQSTDDSASQSEYLNAAIRVLTTWNPGELHRAMIEIEKEFGRERDEHWAPRTIDLDLLIFGDQQIRSKELTVPHPRMSFRRFVLEPALDVAADMVHPESGMTLQQLVDHLEKPTQNIVLATNDASFADAVVANVPSTVHVASTVNAFMTEAVNAKLVVAYFNQTNLDEETEKLTRFAYNFAGPTLRLDETLGDVHATREILAAIDAMQ
ncbi:2-amino-4-hydroxy-6-hydroxymethyldihydropteridine diphosphokinase [Mariniblastus fucicola]|nr:2-amino-4-hydroxy-6-hydroxymethyldihydropteridine diphosphokinase [Mariniblastus fucicola]